MPFLLSRLGPNTGPGLRMIDARDSREEQQVLPDVQALPDGAIVLLEGERPPWTRGPVLRRLPGLPPEIGSILDIWASRSDPQTVRIGDAIVGQGTFAIDDSGTLLEYARCRVGQAAIYVLNYAGWQFVDFPDSALRVEVCVTPVGPVWIVPPDAVPRPASARTVPAPFSALPAPPQPDRLLSPAPGQVVLIVQPEPPLEPVSPVCQPVHVSLRLRFVDLALLDGQVTFKYAGSTVVARSEHVLALYNDLREEFDRELPGGVTAVGIVDSVGAFAGTLGGLEPLRGMFELVSYRAFIRAATETPTWLDAGDVVSHRPGSCGGRDPMDLIGIPEAGLGPRADAFRRLFAHRDLTEPVRVLLTLAVLVPLPAGDGGKLWFAWETVDDGYATYLFRPKIPAALDDLMAWAAGEPKRQELRRDHSLRERFGFVTRVLHYDEGDNQLGRWWVDLQAVVGLRA